MTISPPPSIAYQQVIDELALALVDAARSPLDIVVIDGIPGGGKSSLTGALARKMSTLGRPSVVVENDWFIDRSIRNPLKLAAGLAFALTTRRVELVERELLRRFLDSDRLADFKRQLYAAPKRLSAGQSVRLTARGAYWNLRRPREWQRNPATRGLELRPGGTLIIEGTLTRASYIEEFASMRSVFVQVPPPIARMRFVERNRDPARERNLAFSALARLERPFRLASEMISRNRLDYDFEVDLAKLEAPTLVIRTPQRTSTWAN